MLLIFDWPKFKIHLQLIGYVTSQKFRVHGGRGGRKSRVAQMTLS